MARLFSAIIVFLLQHQVAIQYGLVHHQEKEAAFTLSVVITNPEIDETVLHKLLGSPPNVSEETRMRHFAKRIQMDSFRLRINPVFTKDKGLNEIVQDTFCRPQSRGANAVLLIVDERSDNNGAYVSKFLSTLADRNGLPVMTWSSSMVLFEQAADNNELSMVELAPSIQSQARAMFDFLLRHLPHTKVAFIAWTPTPGFQMFFDELIELVEKDEQERNPRNDTKFEFDSQRKHMSSRFSVYLRMDRTSVRYLRKELVEIRRERQFLRAIMVYSDKLFADVLMDEAHLLGMTTGYETWGFAMPAFAEPIPPNYAPGMIIFTYNTSFEAQVRAIEAGVRIWSEGVRRLIAHASIPNSLRTSVSCTRFTTPKWQYGKIFKRILDLRLEHVRRAYGSFIYADLHKVSIVALEVSRRWKHIGAWSPRDGGNTIREEDRWWNKFHREHSDEQRFPTLRIVVLEERPYIIYQDLVNGRCKKNSLPCRLSPLNTRNHTVACCAGFVIDLLRRLAVDLRFRFYLFEVPDRKWGSLNKATGKWNGLVAAILNNTADMVATSLKINTDRSSAIKFSTQFYQTGITVLVKIRKGVVAPTAFLQPFTVETWAIVFFGFVNSVAICIFVFENFTRSYYMKESANARTKDSILKSSSLFASFWLVLSMLFNASIKRHIPHSYSARFLVSIWGFFCVIFMSSFMANLAAFMITREEWLDFSGLDDHRLKTPYSINPPLKFATIQYGATEHIVKTNFPTMYEHMRAYFKSNVDEGVEAVSNGTLDAFVYDASVLDYKAGRDIDCQLRTVGKWYAPTGYGFGFPQTSKWLNEVNQKLLYYKQTGFMQHLENFWLSSFCIHKQSEQQHSSSILGVINLQSVFTLLALCHLLCGVFLIVERFFGRYWSSLQHGDTCRIISPSLDKARNLRKTLKRNAAMFLQNTEVDCSNEDCRNRKHVLEALVEHNREKARNLERDEAFAILELLEGTSSPSDSPSKDKNRLMPPNKHRARFASCDARLCMGAHGDAAGKLERKPSFVVYKKGNVVPTIEIESERFVLNPAILNKL